MKTAMCKRIVAFILICLCLLPSMPALAASTDSFRCEKNAETQPDGSVRITLQAYQTGRVPAADIVLVLDVSGSMEHNAIVPADRLDGTKTYYIIYEHIVQIDGKDYTKRDFVPVSNTAAEGETPAWFAEIPGESSPREIDPAATDFYTGAMDNLRAAAAGFARSIAENGAEYDADHRIAVVEFSSSEPKSASALCTHDNPAHTPFYANILTGDGSPANALLSAQTNAEALEDVFRSLRADGATYSDDALTQAQRILAGSDASERVVILFTDGGPGSYGWEGDIDNSALPTANAAIAAAGQMKSQGIQIFTIGVFNESNLSGSVGEKNAAYLQRISSNYPNAQSMDAAGEAVSDIFCSIGETNMDLSRAFSAISTVIGTPVSNARVQDVVSRYFVLTDAQKQALLAAYPQLQITDHDDGTTTLALDNVHFPTVPVRSDNSPVDPDDPGIFSMTFDVTPREDFLGGQGVETNTGVCGVFANGVQLAAFDAPRVNVPAREQALGELLRVHDVSLYAGQTLRAAQLYDDLSDSWTAAFADSVLYTAADAEGVPFTETVPAQSGTYTVTVHVRIGAQEYTRSQEVSVTVMPNTVTALTVTPTAGRTSWFVGDEVTAADFQVTARMADGSVVPVDALEVTVSPAVFTTPGTQGITVTVGGVSRTLYVNVRVVEPVRAAVVQEPTNRVFVYRSTPDFSGLAVEVTYSNGKTETIRDTSLMTIRPQSDARIRRGEKSFLVTTQGVSASFSMRVRLVWWQWLILILLFGWIWY